MEFTKVDLNSCKPIDRDELTELTRNKLPPTPIEPSTTLHAAPSKHPSEADMIEVQHPALMFWKGGVPI